MINEARQNSIAKILETALANNGATLIKLMNDLPVSNLVHELKTYLSILENHGLISYQKGDGIYRATYKGRQFLRTYKFAINFLVDIERSGLSFDTF